MFDDVQDLYQETILDHCKNPRHFMEMKDATCSAQGHNPLCGDQLKLFLRVDEGIIREVSFVGSGCCISKASASLLTETVVGRTTEEALRIFDAVHRMITTGKPDPSLGRLVVLAGVSKYPTRVKCAMLAWHALAAAIKGQTTQVTTELDEK
jgi:nitrogen fixation NifU-like protein